MPVQFFLQILRLKYFLHGLFLCHRLIDSTVQQHHIALYLSHDPVSLVDILNGPFILCYTHYFFSQNNFHSRIFNSLCNRFVLVQGSDRNSNFNDLFCITWSLSNDYQNTNRILWYRNLYSNTQKHCITYVLIDWKHNLLVDWIYQNI